jgi:ParB-like nuclease family protein
MSGLSSVAKREVLSSKRAEEVEQEAPLIAEIDSLPVVSVPIESLVFGGSPRQGGEDPEHTRALAEAEARLPPIIVHRSTMRVIDGMHRVRAARIKGEDLIAVRLVDCDEGTAFVLAVKANVTHGLPLSQADRKAAAARVIVARPDWSDRSVAASTGLSDKTVSVIRARSTAEDSQSNNRLGRDGRLRPLNSAARRRRAAAMINENPEAGIREIARATGLSPSTVQDVRQRADRGEDPVPARYRDQDGELSPADVPRQVGRKRRDRTTSRELTASDVAALLLQLRSDPSLKFNEDGRYILRWLFHHVVDADSCERLGDSVPDHWASVVADLARTCAVNWKALADQLDERVHEGVS